MNKLSERTQSIIRLALFALPLANGIMLQFGFSPLPLGEAELEAVLTGVVTMIAGLWIWYKNNNVTKEAILKKEATEGKTNEELKKLADI